MSTQKGRFLVSSGNNPTDEMANKNIVTLMVVLVCAVIVAAVIWMSATQPGREEAASSASPQRTSVLQGDVSLDVAGINPAEKANPFKAVKTNPFE